MESALALSPQFLRSAFGPGSHRPHPHLVRLPSRILLPLRSLNSKRLRQGSGMRCLRAASSNSPGPSSSGDPESKSVLDAFFLGKAFAEALNERIGSAVGEVLSIVGQWQAEQQKQVVDFQEEVIQRAKVAKEKAALEALDGQDVLLEPVRTVSDSSSPAASAVPSEPSNDPLEKMLEG